MAWEWDTAINYLSSESPYLTVKKCNQAYSQEIVILILVISKNDNTLICTCFIGLLWLKRKPERLQILLWSN